MNSEEMAVDQVDNDEYKQALCEQADFYGMESLTETEQCIVNEWEIGKA